MENVTNYQIEMLNVGAADALLIYYTFDRGDRLILVDGGNYSDGERIMNHIHAYYPRRPYIDLAIITHPDDDHIGGVVKMLEALRDKESNAVMIYYFWVNDPSLHGYVPSDVKNNISAQTLFRRLRSTYDVNEDSSKNLLDLIDELGIGREEAFAGANGKNIPIYILGPTKEYYTSLIPKFRGIDLNFKETDYSAPHYSLLSDIVTGTPLSPSLDDTADDTSAPNRSSIIFAFKTSQNEKCLFCGDASRDSFDHIPEYLSGQYKNVTWLKVPHHGSAHNLDSTLIKAMKPKVAYISSEKEGHYTDRCTWMALKRSGCEVYSTHRDHIDIIYKCFDNRPGLITIAAL